MMTGKEKLYFLLDRIDDKRVLTPAGQPILIHPAGDLNSHYPTTELQQLLYKLQEDEKIFLVVRTPDESEWSDLYYDMGYYGIEILPKFDVYFAKIQLEPEYQSFSGKRPKDQPKLTTSNEPKQDNQPKADVPNVVYEITYTGSREILLNKIFQIAKPDFDSENDLVFDFLYKHPNKKYTLKEIEEGIGNKLGKTLHKIVENLGFKGDLRRIFIDVSGTSICFKNPVTKDDLERIGITRIKVSL